MPSSLLVAENLRFDSRLALFHDTERWLAIADLHYGYELSQRIGGALFPAWGMNKIEERVASLVATYQPQTLLFLGDLVHTAAASENFMIWKNTLENTVPELILIRGNHDRRLKTITLHNHWRIGSHLFHHGDHSITCEPGEIFLSGHLHPAETVSDGAGLRQKLPALLQTPTGWILPAFSPWAAGGHPYNLEITDRWIANGNKIWKIKAH